MTVVAAISHKGGAGRSVTLANIAFQLNQHSGKKNKSICVVDLDFASPTMGSIFGIRGLEGGVRERGTRRAPKSLFDLLSYPKEAVFEQPETGAECFVDVKSRASGTFSGKLNGDPPLIFLPGYQGVGDWAGSLSDLHTKLTRLINYLKEGIGFTHILLDVRSGSSNVLQALSRVQREKNWIGLVLVHIKWTFQHIEGLDALLDHDRMKGFQPDSIKIVRTAHWTPEEIPAEDFERGQSASQINRSLEERLSRIKIGENKINLHDRNHVIATIPDSPILRIREGVIVNEEDRCYKAFKLLGERVATHGVGRND